MQYETILRVLEEERDYYKKEYEALKLNKRASTPVRFSPSKVSYHTLTPGGQTWVSGLVTLLENRLWNHTFVSI